MAVLSALFDEDFFVVYLNLAGDTVSILCSYTCRVGAEMGGARRLPNLGIMPSLSGVEMGRRDIST